METSTPRESLREIKDTTTDRKFQTLLFSKPPFFLHSQRELHCNKLPKQQFFRIQFFSVAWLFGINFRRRKLIQVSVSSNKSFKL